MRRPAVIALVAAVAGLALPQVASAHVRLVSTSPDSGARLARAPAVLRMRFDEPPILRFSQVEVSGDEGRMLADASTRLRLRGSVVIVPLARAGKGRYTVHWQMLSDDGHVVRGAFAYGVDRAAGTPQPFPGDGPGVRADILRWLTFLSFALAGGTLLVRRLVLPVLPARARPAEWRRSVIMASLAVVVGLHADLYGYIEWTHEVIGGDWRSFSEAQINALRWGTPTGQAWTVTTFTWLLALLLLGAALAWPRYRDRLATTAGAVTIATAAGLSLSGHAAAREGRLSLAVAADFGHMVAAALWLGGLVWLAVVLWPVAGACADRRAILAAGVARFSALATWLVAALAAGGVYLALVRIHRLGDLGEGYGEVLVVKTAIAAVALLFGLRHRVLVLPRLRRPALGLPRLDRSLAVEALVVAAALLAAAVLTNTAPPAR
ncbi:MAG TPA: copper resistance protein CopC [Gaiellales bacterium]|nr:copper resistance protein CopC [Gaiellales bacterium]